MLYNFTPEDAEKEVRELIRDDYNKQLPEFPDINATDTYVNTVLSLVRNKDFKNQANKCIHNKFTVSQSCDKNRDPNGFIVSYHDESYTQTHVNNLGELIDLLTIIIS